MYRDQWWRLTGDQDEEAPADVDPFGPGEGKCRVEDIMTALEGCVMTDLLPLATNNGLTISGKVSHYLFRGRPPPYGHGGRGSSSFRSTRLFAVRFVW